MTPQRPPNYYPFSVSLIMEFTQARTGRGIHGLPKVSYGPAMPDPYMPCGRATPQTPLRPFGGGLRPSSSPLDTPRRTGLNSPVVEPYGYIYEIWFAFSSSVRGNTALRGVPLCECRRQ
jgi:hypothetical protein